MADADERRSFQTVNNPNRISSETLALFIVDALIDAKVVKQEDLKKALEIAIEEINVRKAAGDY
jgi:hypothetical protein